MNYWNSSGCKQLLSTYNLVFTSIYDNMSCIYHPQSLLRHFTGRMIMQKVLHAFLTLETKEVLPCGLCHPWGTSTLHHLSGSWMSSRDFLSSLPRTELVVQYVASHFTTRSIGTPHCLNFWEFNRRRKLASYITLITLVLLLMPKRAREEFFTVCQNRKTGTESWTKN